MARVFRKIWTFGRSKEPRAIKREGRGRSGDSGRRHCQSVHWSLANGPGAGVLMTTSGAWVITPGVLERLVLAVFRTGGERQRGMKTSQLGPRTRARSLNVHILTTTENIGTLVVLWLTTRPDVSSLLTLATRRGLLISGQETSGDLALVCVLTLTNHRSGSRSMQPIRGRDTGNNWHSHNRISAQHTWAIFTET